MKLRLLMTSVAAALVLGACGGGGKSSPSSASGDTVYNGSCRMVRGDNAGHGRNVLYRCDGNAVLRSAEAKSVLDPSVSVSFGGGGAVVQSGLTSNQTSRRFGKSDAASCERAFLNAVKRFQVSALKHGARRVVNLHSTYDGVLRGGQFNCAAGTFHSRVVLKGDIAR